jgi:hypothetical protein
MPGDLASPHVSRRSIRPGRSQLALCAALSVALATSTCSDAAASATKSYRGLAAWVDIFDTGPWERPERLMRAFSRRGVTTVFVQTSNHRRRTAIHRPRALTRMLRAADRRGIDVIAWYLPGFKDPGRDWRHVKAAVTFESPSGHRFDGFALDIEATAVADIGVRNRRMLHLSGRLRDFVGPRYALGAITPDPVTQRYWPRFPWRAVGKRFDVVLPMCYWTFRVAGEARVYRYAREALRSIRARTGDPSVPVHLIGGIASDASDAEVRGFARAAMHFRAAGASLYDAPITRPGQWRNMAGVPRMKASS